MVILSTFVSFNGDIETVTEFSRFNFNGA
jgi:hypothetical protein